MSKVQDITSLPKSLLARKSTKVVLVSLAVVTVAVVLAKRGALGTDEVLDQV